MNKADGSPCLSQQDTLDRWKEYYESALNHPAAPPCPDLEDLAASTVSDADTPIDAPTLDEVHAAIRKLQNGRAAGPDRIPAELLKCATDPVAKALHHIFCIVWASGKVPAEWKEGIIVALYKGKGSRKECSNYRPITLLSVPGKVFSHVMLARLQPLLSKNRRPEQSGFTTGRSTMDAILTLRLLSEIHREFDHPLAVAYVDIKAAFDSVDRKALWLALKGIGVPDVLMRLIQDLHDGSCARVRVGPQKSDSFITRSGVRQGCVLAPSLFCRAMDWILQRMPPTCGITVGQSSFTDDDYADDVALLGKKDSDLQSSLYHFNRQANSLGLNVSWTKTKIQSTGGNLALNNITVDGQVIEAVDEFIYLGSKLTSDGRCSPDILRRIGIASSSMNDLNHVWSQKKLSLSTKLRIYATCVLPIALYGAEVWTLLKQDLCRLEAFHMRNQRRILGIKWSDFVRNTTVTAKTGLESIATIITRRRSALFGHVARLGNNVPANRALDLAINIRNGQPPDPTWKRPRGRPRQTWLHQIETKPSDLRSAWDAAVLRGHGQTCRRDGPPVSTR